MIANSTLILRFTDLITNSNESQLTINIRLCWSIAKRITIGHCLKALFNDLLFAISQQWLDYHLLVGIEQFYIYDRTLRYQSLLQSYIDREQVVHVVFPLAIEIHQRERFDWIDQFVGKMHCLMRTRTSVQWLGTWDLDECINIYSDRQQVFLPNCSYRVQQCHSMLSDYLDQNFHSYNNIIIYAVNCLQKRSLTSERTNQAYPIVIEQFQHRLTQWNDRVKYLVRPYVC
jgi:hypothetical protein